MLVRSTNLNLFICFIEVCYELRLNWNLLNTLVVIVTYIKPFRVYLIVTLFITYIRKGISIWMIRVQGIYIQIQHYVDHTSRNI